jgi:hypothetical protein
LGFKKPDGNELARNGDNIIADNAQTAEDLINALRTRTPEQISADAALAGQLQAARNPEAMFTGAITYSASGAPTAASVVWPDGVGGTYTGTASTVSPGSVDAYTITRNETPVKTFTQPTITRDSTTGNVTNRPPITVS